MERGFKSTEDTFTKAAAEFDPASAPPDADVLKVMGEAYIDLLTSLATTSCSSFTPRRV